MFNHIMARYITSVTSNQLIRLYSSLKKPQLLKATQISSLRNDVSKDPSLWEQLDIEFDSKDIRMIADCFKFVSEVPYVRKLRLRSRSDNKIFIVKDSKIHQDFNNMMMMANQLKCFSVNENIQIQSPYLPASLTHAKLAYLKEHEIVEFLEKNNGLEYLNVTNCHGSIDISSIKALMKHVNSLKHLYIPCNKAHCLDMLGNLSNLKELVLYFCLHLNDKHIANFSQLKNLEHLCLQGTLDLESCFTASQAHHELSALKHLAIVSCAAITDDCFNVVCKKMPNLESFSVIGTHCSVDVITNFIKKCKTLKDISIYIRSLDDVKLTKFLEGVLKIHKERPFESVCFCSLKEVSEYKAFENLKPFSEELQKLFGSFTCRCPEICLEHINSYDNHCFPN